MSTTANTSGPENNGDEQAAARQRLASTERNQACPCGSGKKYKRCHLLADEAATAPAVIGPKPEDHVQNGWRLFEQRRPGAAEKEFRSALAQRPGWVDAQVGAGMAALSAGDNDRARTDFEAVIAASEPLAKQLQDEKVTDAFMRQDAQSYIRAAHALGCLAYDTGKYDESASTLARVYNVDDGTVGLEARLIAAKALMKQNQPADAAAVVEPIVNGKGAGRGHAALALALFAKGDRPGAEAALKSALVYNPFFGKALLGQLKKRVDNPALARPGSREEAVVYAQTYGDVWDDAAKAFLTEELAKVEATEATAGGSAPAEAPPASP